MCGEEFEPEVTSDATNCDQLKRCTNCGLSKAVKCFSRNRRKVDRLDVHCRECIRERIRNKKALHVASGKCADCGSQRDSGSHTYCGLCLVARASTERRRQMRAETLLAYGGRGPRCGRCGG